MGILLSDKIEKLLKALEEKNKEGGYWNISRESGEYLYSLISQHRPHRIVEVGASNGYSTIWLALAAQEVGATVTSYEFDPKKIGEWAQNLKKAGLLRFCAIIPDNATERLGDLEGPIDFVFLDARKSDYIKHIKLLEPKLSDNVLIAADNILSHPEQTKEYIEYVRNSAAYTSELNEIGTGIEITRRLKTSN